MPTRTWPARSAMPTRSALPAWAGVAALLLAMLARVGWLDWAVSPPFTESAGVVAAMLFFVLISLVVVAVVGFLAATAYALFTAARAAVKALLPVKRPAAAGGGA